MLNGLVLRVLFYSTWALKYFIQHVQHTFIRAPCSARPTLTHQSVNARLGVQSSQEPNRLADDLFCLVSHSHPDKQNLHSSEVFSLKNPQWAARGWNNTLLGTIFSGRLVHICTWKKNKRIFKYSSTPPSLHVLFHMMVPNKWGTKI